MSGSRPGKSRRAARTSIALVLGLAGALLLPHSAGADPAGTPGVDPTAAVVLNFGVNGKSTVKKLNSELPLGPGALKAAISITPAPDPNDWVADIKGDLTLPESQGSFDLIGFIPVTTTVSFVPDGPVSGQLRAGQITATSKVFVKLSKVKVSGIDIHVGDRCQTKSSATINLVSGPGYDLLKGGTLSTPAGYTIPDFRNCGIHDFLLSSLISGPGNQLSLTLAKA